MLVDQHHILIHCGDTEMYQERSGTILVLSESWFAITDFKCILSFVLVNYIVHFQLEHLKNEFNYTQEWGIGLFLDALKHFGSKQNICLPVRVFIVKIEKSAHVEIFLVQSIVLLPYLFEFSLMTRFVHLFVRFLPFFFQLCTLRLSFLEKLQV